MANYKIVDGDCRISSPFGTRKDPFGSGKDEFHSGVDFAPNPPGKGYPIKAIEAGTVLLLRYASPELGNYVEILHPNGYVSRYQHLSLIASTLATGQAIKEGTFLGVMGTTGKSTGVHLHLSIRTVREQVSDRYIDPMPYVMGTASMSGKAPAAPTPVPPQEAPAPRTHTVKSGDSLWQIAVTYLGAGGRFVDIKAFNGMTTDMIRPGQVLKIPNK